MLIKIVAQKRVKRSIIMRLGVMIVNIFSIAILITIANKPKVRIMKGNEKKRIIGLRVKLISPKMKPASANSTIFPLKETPCISFVIKYKPKTLPIT